MIGKKIKYVAYRGADKKILTGKVIDKFSGRDMEKVCPPWNEHLFIVVVDFYWVYSNDKFLDKVKCCEVLDLITKIK